MSRREQAIDRALERLVPIVDERQHKYFERFGKLWQGLPSRDDIPDAVGEVDSDLTKQPHDYEHDYQDFFREVRPETENEFEARAEAALVAKRDELRAKVKARLDERGLTGERRERVKEQLTERAKEALKEKVREIRVKKYNKDARVLDALRKFRGRHRIDVKQFRGVWSWTLTVEYHRPEGTRRKAVNPDGVVRDWHTVAEGDI